MNLGALWLGELIHPSELALGDLFTGGEGFTQGVSLAWEPTDAIIRAEIAYTDGINQPNRNFQDFPTAGINADFGVAANPKAPVWAGHFGGWMLLFTATFGYAAGWNPYAADYTRYLPPDTNRRMVGLWAALGVFVSCVVLEMAGAALATVAGTKWGPTDIPTVQLQRGPKSSCRPPVSRCLQWQR